MPLGIPLGFSRIDLKAISPLATTQARVYKKLSTEKCFPFWYEVSPIFSAKTCSNIFCKNLLV